MKKKIFTLVFCCILSTSTSAFAENETKDIMFRNIPWNATKAEAEELLISDGAKIERAAYPDNVLRLSGITHINVTSGSDRVDGGGFVGRYSGFNVAGYKVSDTYASYIFSMNEDGTINKNVDDASFYFGWYTFDSNDYVDAIGVYEDLKVKLSSLYGEGEEDTSDDYLSTVTWVDSDNDTIRLLLGAKDRDTDYVTLGYIENGADAMLDEMQIALDKEAAESEAAERKENAADVSGL